MTLGASGTDEEHFDRTANLVNEWSRHCFPWARVRTPDRFEYSVSALECERDNAGISLSRAVESVTATETRRLRQSCREMETYNTHITARRGTPAPRVPLPTPSSRRRPALPPLRYRQAPSSIAVEVVERVLAGSGHVLHLPDPFPTLGGRCSSTEPQNARRPGPSFAMAGDG